MDTPFRLSNSRRDTEMTATHTNYILDESIDTSAGHI
jgi:hypothetical protein